MIEHAAATEAALRWPVISTHPRGREIAYQDSAGNWHGEPSRSFGAARRNGARYHAGVDLWGNYRDVIVAPEAGELVNTYHFYDGTHALFLQCDSGLVLNLAEVAADSWTEFGVDVGSRVAAGDRIARVGRFRQSLGSMCHFEAYRDGTRWNERWKRGSEPLNLLNPTHYLLALAARDETPLPRPTLRKGDRGSHVQDLQELLAQAGHTLIADGHFGERTELAVERFQGLRDLVPDGIVGPQTWAALEAN